MKKILRLVLFFPLFISLLACNSTTQRDATELNRPLPVSKKSAAPFRSEKLVEIDAAINQAIVDKKLPGGVLWLEHGNQIYKKSFGNRALVPVVEPMSTDTIFDAASLTKVVATTPAMMLLIERGLVKLDEPVKTYIPEFAANGKENVTIRHLMTHTSGLPSGIRVNSEWSGQKGAIEKASATKLTATPGTLSLYSDINFFTLGEVVQRVTHQPLQDFVKKEIYQPLQMNDTGYLPSADKISRIAPTEPGADKKMLRGVVHDPTSRNMGGVAGHAGLFTTAADLARYARMYLNEGTLDSVRIFKPETVRLMTTVQSPASVPARRGLGWDIDSSYASVRGEIFPLGGFGHTGWTGTSIWIDPFSKTFLIFLSNRNHPDGAGNVISLRRNLGTLAAEAITDFNFTDVTGALPPRPKSTSEPKLVLNGIDTLVRQHFLPLKGLKLGLITNHTGRDRDRNQTIDLLKNEPGVTLKKLFSPEHGLRGALDEKVGDSVDEKTGLPIYSLYNATPKRKPDQSDADFQKMAMESRQPKQEHLQDIDALVFDIQDIGCRFYTYISTLGGAMDAAARAGKRIIVLDRVNPITGTAMDGPVLTSHTSFTAFHAIPVRHGMTVGEIAKMFNAERDLKADLTVIQLDNWSRAMWFDETGLPWTNPSPNMRSLNEAALYPGVGLLEFNPLSVGRGTDTPFEVVGAPYIDDTRFTLELNRAGLPGVRFVPVRFTPNASTFKGLECGGANIILTNRDECHVVDIGITIALTLQRLYPNEFKIEKFSKLLGHSATLAAVKENKSLAEIKNLWMEDFDKFKKRRDQFLIYK